MRWSVAQARTLVYEPLRTSQRDAQRAPIETVAIDVISSRRQSRVFQQVRREAGEE